MTAQRDNAAVAASALDRVFLSMRDNFEAWYGPSPDGPGWVNGIRRPVTDVDHAWMRACRNLADRPRLQAVREQPASPPAQPRLLADVVEFPAQSPQLGREVVDLVLEPHERSVGAVLDQMRELVRLQLVRRKRAWLRSSAMSMSSISRPLRSERSVLETPGRPHRP